MKDYAENMISVVIPVYGNFDIRRTLLSVQSALQQRNVNLEVVVSEQGVFPKLKKLLPEEVKYLFVRHVPQKNLSDFNPGHVRASAINISSGEFVYTNDADIVFLNENYLYNCLEILLGNPERALHRPPMRRLPLDNFERFWEIFNKRGIQAALEQLYFSQKYLATTDGIMRPLKVVSQKSEYYTKIFTTSLAQFNRYAKDLSLRGKEPMIWSENLHCGGNFFRKTHYYAVGGYCLEFINWGCEDSDLQWKLAYSHSLEFFPNEKKFEVLHLDHHKEYFSSEMWKRNEGICAKRKKIGVVESIKRDIENGKQ